ARPSLLAGAFAGAARQVPGMLDALEAADDVFCDTAAQIHVPRWHRGRVALVGDAAYAPSFLTGQGTSLALAGAYMLASSLAGRDQEAGLAAYEAGTRPFVTANQELIGEDGASLFPRTAAALERRNARLRGLAALPAPPRQPAHTALTLPG
ncbi:FAD-dependent oxidoreductase, partial [Streptomyces sp. SID5785]|uniref:FAD-dependent monooxygenase n=1 Tax=Streptomyces sp. SID5785 TaxID=2690309 RepID=UPI00136149AB